MTEPQYDQSDANLYYTMQELRELRKRVENAEATLAAIRTFADRNLPYVTGQNTVELRALNHGYASARMKVLALLDAIPKEELS